MMDHVQAGQMLASIERQAQLTRQVSSAGGGHVWASGGQVEGVGVRVSNVATRQTLLLSPDETLALLRFLQDHDDELVQMSIEAAAMLAAAEAAPADRAARADAAWDIAVDED